MESTVRLGILASHAGTTLQAVLDACADGRLRIPVAVVICNNRGARALDRARDAGVPAVNLNSVTHPNAAELDGAIRDVLLEYGASLILLAGYMRKIGPAVLKQFRGRILNTHPALLPRFGGQGMYGPRVHEAVLKAGVSETGVSVHLVDEDYDTGRLIAQCRVSVQPGDTPESLASRVQARERAFLVEVLADVAAGRVALDND